MTVEQLLKPRYKVIADYPGSNISVNDVYEPPQNKEIETFWNKYPHLFRKLHWWEDRKPEEMPEYIKNKDGVFKVDRWEYDGDTEVKNEILCILSDFYGSHLDHYPDNIDALPATETEYNEHLKTLNP